MIKQKEAIWLKIVRILLACVFLYSGFTKAIDPIATSYTFDDYFTSFKMGFMHPLSLFFAFCMSAAEFTLGFMMLFRIKMKFTAWCYLLFMVFFFFLTLWLAIAEYLETKGYNFGVVHDCGCFGEAVKLTNKETFLKNVVIMIPTLIVFFKRKQIPDIRLTELGQWCFAAIGALMVFGLEAHCYRHLPIIDYSNWKVGENVAKNFINRPAVVDDQTSVYIYKNKTNNNLITVTLDELDSLYKVHPNFDETYVFVESKNKIISEEVVSPHQGFNMLDTNGFNKEPEIFFSEAPAYIFFMHNLDETNLKGIQNEEFKRIVNHCIENGITVVGVTNSEQETIRKFCQDNNIPFPIYENPIDNVKGPFIVRDAIRSNPGLMIIQGGIVKAKYSWRDFKKVKTEN